MVKNSFLYVIIVFWKYLFLYSRQKKNSRPYQKDIELCNADDAKEQHKTSEILLDTNHSLHIVMFFY